ncbi:MAG: hypothetical protein D6798_19295 [Deltaproteobacteria bacterium]|nr:MAG: hypothetical protein D6798_19295 [Deltaproteobacteria bacterium]
MPGWRGLLLLGNVLAWGGGCSGVDRSAGEADTGAANDGAGAGDGGSLAGDTGAVARWWSLDADLQIVDGELDASGSTLTLSLRTEDQQVCADVVPPTSATASPAPHPAVYAWWAVTWDPAALHCLDEGVPLEGRVELGIGALDPEIRVLLGRLDDVRSDDAVEALNGAYASLPADDRLLVFGAAGPPAAFEGEGSPATTAPLADGSWWVRAVYTFDL